MSIVKAINELSGKEAVTIEDAIRNVELGGSGESDFLITITQTGYKSYSMDKTFDEIENAYAANKAIKLQFDQSIAGMIRRETGLGGVTYTFSTAVNYYINGDSATIHFDSFQISSSSGITNTGKLATLNVTDN